MYCNKCGNEIKGNFQFCEKCGNQIEDKSNNKVKDTKKITIIVIAVLVVVIAIILKFNLNFDEKEKYSVKTSTGSTITLKINNTILDKGIAELQKSGCSVNKIMGVIYKGNRIQKYIVVIDNDPNNYFSEYGKYMFGDSNRFGPKYSSRCIDPKTGKVDDLGNEVDALGTHSVEYVIEMRAKTLTKNNNYGIFYYGEEPSEVENEYEKWLQEEQQKLNEAEQEMQKVENSLGQETVKTQTKEQKSETKDTKATQNNLTGIEQAIKDGMIGEDYITKGVSRGQLEFAFTDGNLQMYYDTWEECLADAEKLNIITSDEEYLTMEEELDRYYNGI